MIDKKLKSPVVYFGAKSKVSLVVWERFGAVHNFIDPCMGSAAMLLGRPEYLRTNNDIETINDKNGFVSNFWRAVKADSAAVADAAYWPVNENDLHARHAWLRGKREGLTAVLEGDPEFYDARIAGWWAWGMSCSIGSKFCNQNQVGPWIIQTENEISLLVDRRIVGGDEIGITKNLPYLGGSHSHKQGITCADSREELIEWFKVIEKRLEKVRVASGDWSRVCGPSVTYGHGLTGMFFDPPYNDENCDQGLYDCNSKISADIRQYCIENSDNKLMRIALCGYEGEGHDVLVSEHGWSIYEWKANGGYGNQRSDGDNVNSRRERIYFSPHCLNNNVNWV
jgi:DNA adenine methylase